MESVSDSESGSVNEPLDSKKTVYMNGKCEQGLVVVTLLCCFTHLTIMFYCSCSTSISLSSSSRFVTTNTSYS